jgi:hypothetical protein
MAGCGSGHVTKAWSSCTLGDNLPCLQSLLQVMKKFEGQGGEDFFRYVRSIEGGQAFLDRPEVVPYKRPKRAVPTSNAEVTDEMLLACDNLDRSEFNLIGDVAFKVVVAMLAVKRVADGKRTADDMNDDAAAADASTETMSAGIGISAAGDLSYAISTWTQFYVDAGIELHIKLGDYGDDFSLARNGPTSEMAKLYVIYLMTDARKRFDYNDPDFHGLRSGTVGTLISMMAAHGFRTLYPASAWAVEEDHQSLSRDWHADCHRFVPCHLLVVLSGCSSALGCLFDIVDFGFGYFGGPRRRSFSGSCLPHGQLDYY